MDKIVPPPITLGPLRTWPFFWSDKMAGTFMLFIAVAELMIGLVASAMGYGLWYDIGHTPGRDTVRLSSILMPLIILAIPGTCAIVVGILQLIGGICVRRGSRKGLIFALIVALLSPIAGPYAGPMALVFAIVFAPYAYVRLWGNVGPRMA